MLVLLIAVAAWLLVGFILLATVLRRILVYVGHHSRLASRAPMDGCTPRPRGLTQGFQACGGERQATARRLVAPSHHKQRGGRLSRLSVPLPPLTGSDKGLRRPCPASF